MTLTPHHHVNDQRSSLVYSAGLITGSAPMDRVAHFALASVLLAVLGSSWDKVVAADDVSRQICQTAYSQASILLRHTSYYILDLFHEVWTCFIDPLYFRFFVVFFCHHAFCVGVICAFPRQFTCHLKTISKTFNYNSFQNCKQLTHTICKLRARVHSVAYSDHDYPR